MRPPFKLTVAFAAALVSLLACAGSTEPSTSRPSEIIYRETRSDGDRIVAMNADGSGKRVLAKPSDGSYYMSLSPD